MRLLKRLLYHSSGMAPSHPLPTRAQLLKTVTDALRLHCGERDAGRIFGSLLETLLELTGSEYGFIGEVFQDEKGQPYVKSYATTNIAWNEETQRLYEKAREKGMIFSRKDCLYGAVLTTGNLIVSNDPAADSRSCGLPPGHPPLESFMGVPLLGRDGLLGMVGVANRPGGYSLELARRLEPFLVACGSLLQSWRDTRRILALEKALRSCERQSGRLGESVLLGGGYHFHRASSVLYGSQGSVLLTRKEFELLSLLAENAGKVVSYEELKQRVWREVVVGRSSLRSLVRRIRSKAPGIGITTVRGVGLMLATSADS